jgi:hypothetical protein
MVKIRYFSVVAAVTSEYASGMVPSNYLIMKAPEAPVWFPTLSAKPWQQPPEKAYRSPFIILLLRGNRCVKGALAQGAILPLYKDFKDL